MKRSNLQYLLFLAIFLLHIHAIGQHILINEVQYTNRTTLTDLDGDTPDWIEIINKGNVAQNLSGYMLSDDSTETEPWAFPEYILKVDSVIIVYASGKNITEGNELHTDFKLGVLKDPVYLYNPDTIIIDRINASCVPPDKTIGRFPDGLNNLEVLSPTPHQSNASASIVEIDYQAHDKLHIDFQSGFYSGDVTVHLTNDNPDNQIFYTLDGDKPSNQSTPYDGSISLTDINGTPNRFANKGGYEYEPGDLISKANIVRAQAFSEGCPSGDEIINTYFINETDLDSHIPTVSIITDENNLYDDDIGIYVFGNHANYSMRGKKWERDIGIELFNQDGELIVDQNAGIRIHGRSSRTAPQKSIRLYARDEYGSDTFHYPYFTQKPALTHFKTMLLRSTYGCWSGTLLKDEVGQEIVKDLELDYTCVQTVILYVNGEYWGIYSLRERYDEHYVENNYQVDSADIDVISYDKDETLVESGTIDAYNELISNLESLDAESEEFYSYADKNIDLKNLTDFYIAHAYFANIDFPDNNFKLWRLRADDSKWRFFFFDLDRAFSLVGNDHISHYNNTIDYLQHHPAYSTFILRTLLKNSRFRADFNSRFFELLNTSFSPNRVIDIIDEYQSVYEPHIFDNIYRWNMPTDYIKWLHSVDVLRMFAMQRPSVLMEQLLNNYGNPFTVYPNPGKEHIKVRFYGIQESVGLKLFNANGQVVMKEKYSETDLITLYPNLNPGLYVLQIQLASGLFTEKVFIIN